MATEQGLQQATRVEVARLHAQRYVRADVKTVADITAGLGADAVAFAQAGLQVTAVELDPETAAATEANLAEFPNAEVIVGDGLELDLSAFDGVFADPARRGKRGRTFNPDNYSPPLGQVLALHESGTVAALGVKVAPGIGYEYLPREVHAQWVSTAGTVVEAGLWFGPLADGPGRSAWVEGVEVVATSDPRAAAQQVPTRALGNYLYQADGAVIRSGALHVVADMLDAGTVSDGISYLTGNHLVATPLAEAFEVVDVMPLKQVRQYLRSRDVGGVEILKRGVDIVPDQFRKTLRLKGKAQATLVLTRLQGKHLALVVKRVVP